MTNDESPPRAEETVTLRRSDVLERIAALTSEHEAALARATKLARAIDVEKALLAYFPGAEAQVSVRSHTIRDMLKAVMTDAVTPIGIRAMIDAMQEKFGATVARTSISPILRKMLARGEVEHIGTTWTLTSSEAIDRS